MYQVDKAIVFAAGMGQRMRPLSNSIPKPLINVNGKRIIETIIEGLNENDILEIYIVVGYMKELFEYLPRKYQGVSLVTNEDYNKTNNISSLYAVKEQLENVIIIEGDILIKNNKVLSRTFEKSGYNAVWNPNKTNEWLMQVEDGIVKSCSRTGGFKGWQLYGISRWNKEDGIKLRKFLEEEYIDKSNTSVYWDDVVMFLHFDNFKLGIKEMKENDVIEIDNFFELIELDERYKG